MEVEGRCPLTLGRDSPLQEGSQPCTQIKIRLSTIRTSLPRTPDLGQARTMIKAQEGASQQCSPTTATSPRRPTGVCLPTSGASNTQHNNTSGPSQVPRPTDLPGGCPTQPEYLIPTSTLLIKTQL